MVPTQVSTVMRAPPGVSITSMWMLMIRLPSGVAKQGASHGTDLRGVRTPSTRGTAGRTAAC